MTPRRIQLGGGLILEEGIEGVFTREQADGALPNGSRVRKSWEESGDATPLGAEGVILGSLQLTAEIRKAAEIEAGEALPDATFIYFVCWDINPNRAIAIIDAKIEAAP